MSPASDRARPLASLPSAAAAAVRGIFTDIDDTLTTDGAITAPALHALERLRDAGVAVIAITGRPMGWSQPFAREWPLSAIVAENGAVALLPDGERVQVEYAQDEATRQRNTTRLAEAAALILREVPGATLARDSAGRVTDIAVDHSEFAHLDAQRIDQVVARMQRPGMQATVSSIPVNGWYGDHTKWTGAAWMLRRLFGRPLDGEVERWAYVGDSTNDQEMFGRFPLSVGVANLRRFADQLHTWPAYLAQGERGEGFAELAERLISAR